MANANKTSIDVYIFKFKGVSKSTLNTHNKTHHNYKSIHQTHYNFKSQLQINTLSTLQFKITYNLKSIQFQITFQFQIT